MNDDRITAFLILAVGSILLYSGIKNKSPLGIGKAIATGQWDFSKVGSITTAAAVTGGDTSGTSLAADTTSTAAPAAPASPNSVVERTNTGSDPTLA